MLTWIGLLWKASGANRIVPYLVLAGVVLLVIGTAYMQGKSAGKNSESTKRLNDSLNRIHKEAKDRATIHSIESAAARRQLQDRWSDR